MVLYGTKANVIMGCSIITMKYTENYDNMNHMSEYKLRERKGAYCVRPLLITETWAK